MTFSCFCRIKNYIKNILILCFLLGITNIITAQKIIKNVSKNDQQYFFKSLSGYQFGCDVTMGNASGKGNLYFNKNQNLGFKIFVLGREDYNQGFLNNLKIQTEDYKKYYFFLDWKNYRKDNGTLEANVEIQYNIEDQEDRIDFFFIGESNWQIYTRTKLEKDEREILNQIIKKYFSKENEKAAYEKYLRKDLLLDFFKGEWDYETNTCKWVNDSTKSEDKYVFAKVDSIINYTSDNNQKKIAIIKSYPKQNGELMDFCNACFAELSLIELKKENNTTGWQIESSNKYAGSLSQSHKYEILKLWDNKFCLLVYGAWAGMGYANSWVSIFLNSKEQCTETTDEYSENIFGDDTSKNYSNQSKILVDKIKKQIVFHRYGTQYDENLKSVSKMNSFSKYILKNNQIIKLN